ncbi:C1 family peptidase [Liquorilactobacillus mali]|uniref:C1 family peptidase n=1 Tax=Liquorilactobacillus mali TaxID=1618 RepID=UPI002350DA51|nr:C1 family peptidase [Liquorilactobacillus mali]MDC7953661.1 C1 family peptidase [Liquorilactobacillus mali]
MNTKGRDIAEKDLEKFQREYGKSKTNQVVARAVQKNGVTATSEDYEIQKNLARVFSLELETGNISNQKNSGRCWLFATLNTMRHQFASKYKVKDFELSENYNSFYDRLEKANHFYESVIGTAALPFSDRAVKNLFDFPDDDGGQWANAAALVEKYGVVPKSAMPETFNSEKTSEISAVLVRKLRKDGIFLRKLVTEGKSSEILETTKNKFLTEVYRMLVYAFGEPPAKFDYEYRNDDKKYFIDQNITPKNFFKKYFEWNFADYVCLSNAPDHKLNELYELPSQSYIHAGMQVTFANTVIDSLKATTIAQLKDGEAVWFGSDVGKDSNRKLGILSSELYKKSELFDVDLRLDKADRLSTGDGTVSHAMAIVGVDIVEGVPVKWKVENSWGDKYGEKGYFIMSDDWFDQHVYEVIVKKQYLNENDSKILSKQAIKMEPWDSLA